mmetsp:Transcript_18505/g.43137  ORF Transcript_18505/g.43137 Transcript_18505/m.43137 type:complete len:267 (+) Transcript_18505:106-906(+)
MVLFLLPVAAVGVGAAGIALVVLRRRGSPPKLEDALKLSTLGLPRGMKQETSLDAKAREAMYHAFMTGSDFQWISTKPGETKYDEGTLYKISAYMITCVITFSEKYGYILVQRDPETGEFQGSIALIPPYKSWAFREAQFLLSVIPLGQPVPRELGCGDRFDKFVQIDKKHEELLKTKLKDQSSKIWHVQNLAVSPDHQGKGIGRKLLEAARRLCAANGGSLYLECHDENFPFYDKMGYERLERFPLSDEKDGPYYYNAMLLTGKA